MQRPQRRHGEIRAAHEGEAHRAYLARLLPLLLGQPAHDHVALQRRQVIDEQHAVEMVDLVLQAGGEQAVGLDLAPRAGLVQVAHLDPRRPRHVGVLAGQRQAAFLARGQFVAGGDDLRVDQHDRRAACRPASGRPRRGAAAGRPAARPGRCRAPGTSWRTCAAPGRAPASASASRTGRARAFSAGCGAIRIDSSGVGLRLRRLDQGRG